MATIKNFRHNPCPRCLIRKENIHNIGTPADAMHHRRIRADNISRHQDVDKARKALYQHGCKITSTQVQSSLTAHLMVPTQVSITLLYYTLLTHPTEHILGKASRGRAGLPWLFHRGSLAWIQAWHRKSVLTHLIQMLHATPDGQECIALLNERWALCCRWVQTIDALIRFNSVLTFNGDTICKLPDKVSELSKLAVRDYEDILQVHESAVAQ